MGGDEQPSSTQTQETKTEPWGPAKGYLKNLLAKYGALSTDVTGNQQNAADALVDSATGLPNFGNAGADAVNKGFNFSTTPQIGMLSDAYGDLQGRLGATANGANLNPYMTPGFGDALDTMSSDITDRVKGVYAAAGRDPSGAGSFAGSLGRGLTEGLAPVIQSQYNKNVDAMTDASKTLFGAGGTTATGITGQQQAENAAGLGALGASGAVSDAFMNPAMKQLLAANQQYNLPWTNLSALLNPLTQIGGLGGQSTGTTTGTQNPGNSTMSNIFGGISAGAAMLPIMFSDERLKDDIAPVGQLNDGQTVYRYRMKGSPKFQIGLLAQESDEDAVMPVGGLLAMDYKKATDKAVRMQ